MKTAAVAAGSAGRGRLVSGTSGVYCAGQEALVNPVKSVTVAMGELDIPNLVLHLFCAVNGRCFYSAARSNLKVMSEDQI